MSNPVLRVKNLSTRLGRGPGAVRAVDRVSFEVGAGETFALLGESGCGKSMTALSLMRLVPWPGGRIVGGEVWLKERELLRIPEADMRGIRGVDMAMIFQEPMTSLNPVLRVGAQIEEGVRLHRLLRGAAARRRTLELLNVVGMPDPQRRYGEYPHQLSGGMKQRVLIAAALAGDPNLLIADEPTTALDVTIQAQVLALLRQVQRERAMAVLLITHDLGVVAETADRVAVMYAGELVEQASIKDFFANCQHPYSRRLFDALPSLGKRASSLAAIPGSVPPLNQEIGGCRFAPRCDFAWSRCFDERPGWTTVAQDHQARCHLVQEGRSGLNAHRPGSPEQGQIEMPAGGKAQLNLENVKVHFPIRRGVLRRTVAQVRAVDGISLSIGRGRTLAVVGESGCGKTTLARAIVRLERVTAGRVELDDTDLSRLRGRPLAAQRRKMQMVFQDPFSSMNPRMTIGEVVAEGITSQRLTSSASQTEARVAELLERVGLPEGLTDRYPHEFSGGQRQRICIARALATAPQLLILDEPTSALDVSVQAQILNLLRALQRERRLTYLFITHNISVVAYLADEVAVMYLGRIVEQGGVEEILRRPRHPYTQALLAAVPVPDPGRRREIMRLGGDQPSPVHPPAGCHFHPRCPEAMAKCKEVYPPVTDLGRGHRVHCHLCS